MTTPLMHFEGATSSGLRIVPLAQATLKQRADAAGCRDHHGRALTLPPLLPSAEPLGQHVFLAVDGDDAVRGWVSLEFPALTLIRDLRSEEGAPERYIGGASLTFPCTPRADRDVWHSLIEHSLRFLEQQGVERANVYVPLDSTPALDALHEHRFEPAGFCDHRASLADNGWVHAPSCRVLSCALQPAAQRFDILPRLLSGSVRSNASSFDAPEPTVGTWSSALYSSYSLYAQVNQLLPQLLSPTAKSMLSAPAASGDFLRLLDPELVPERTGIDICPNAIDLARHRLEEPWLDELNAHLLKCFALYRSGGMSTGSLLQSVAHVTSHLGCGATGDEVARIALQLRAAFDKTISSPAVRDYWALVKILSFALHPAAEHVMDAIDALVERREQAAACLATARDYEKAFCDAPARERVTLLRRDLSQPLELTTAFDVTVSFEALLMWHSAGDPEPYLDNLARHTNPGGLMVLTGIRSQEPVPPAELNDASDWLRARGFDVQTFFLNVPPSTWLLGADAVRVPVLTAWAPA